MQKKSPLKKILVATDLSPLSAAAVGYALSLAEKFQATIELVHIVDDIPLLGMRTVDLTPETVRKKALEESHKALQKFYKDHFGTNPNVFLVVKEGSPAKGIVEHGISSKADLIILSTHGRTGLKKVIFGSVAQEVVRLSPIPVLSVKPDNSVRKRTR